MARQVTDDNDNLFAQYMERDFTSMKRMEPGQMLETDIVSVSGDSIFLQLDGKSEGVIDRAELTDRDGNLTVKEGDRIKVFFLTAQNGEMRFTTRISGDKAGSAVLENAFKNGIPVEGVVEKEIKGGFEVKIGESRAFCPYSQMARERVENAATWVGKHLTFKIMEHGENGRNILVSNRAILEEERRSQIEILKKTWHEKMVVKGTIKSVQDFGAFVDVSGIQALLPVSEIGRSRVEDIRKVLTPGQEIEAVVIKLDWQNDKITLSLKALLSDPWDGAVAKYKPGTRHTGEVVRLTAFGAFVALEPGLDGLIHISDLEGDSRDANPRLALKKGQSLIVKINSIDSGSKRISLKPVSSMQEEEDLQKYMAPTESDTYNPFADFLKNKPEKKGKK
jgi:small subunit ribosomal protein S1